MARKAYAHQVVIIHGSFRKVGYLFYVMDYSRLLYLPISLAHLALVIIPCEDCGAFLLPLR